MRRIVLLSLFIVVLVSGCAMGAARKSSRQAKTYTARNIPQSPFLPVYANPQEVDLKNSDIHISFKGAFRGIDDYGRQNDWVYFAFTAEPEEDMTLSVSQSELFDGRSRSYKYYAVPSIGGERVCERELIAGVSVPVLLGVNMPLDAAGDLPSISRITITFNGESLQFRNVIVETWETWESLRDSLSL